MHKQKNEIEIQVKLDPFTVRRIRKVAELEGKTPEEVAIFFLSKRCNTPALGTDFFSLGCNTPIKKSEDCA